MTLPTIAAVIADVLGLGPAHGIGPATRLCEDLATDSLDRQCIAVDCDMAFWIEISDGDDERLGPDATLRTLLDLIERKIAAKVPA